MNIITRYFPSLSSHQIEQISVLKTLYAEWNEKINVVSRKDIDNLFERHILHSMSIARYITFIDGTSVMDVGTGGGLPGIPLAILFPNVHFHLVDRIGKKVKVAEAIASSIGLSNTSLRHCGVEEEKQQFDFVVSRAVMPLSGLYSLTRKNIKKVGRNAIPNGIICLKGGELDDEVKPFKNICEIINLNSYYSEEFFETKKLVYLPIQ